VQIGLFCLSFFGFLSVQGHIVHSGLRAVTAFVHIFIYKKIKEHHDTDPNFMSDYIKEYMQSRADQKQLARDTMDEFDIDLLQKFINYYSK